MTERFGLRRKIGREPFVMGDRQATDITTLDFWQWSCSNLLANTTRGILAEFLVGKALGLTQETFREEWELVDFRLGDGTTIEVKSSAYLQSWHDVTQPPSNPEFRIAKTKAWNRESGQYEGEPRRWADIYVFCLLAEKDLTLVNPLDLSQWELWITDKRALENRLSNENQRTAALSIIKRICGSSVGFSELKSEIEQVHCRIFGKSSHIQVDPAQVAIPTH